MNTLTCPDCGDLHDENERCPHDQRRAPLDPWEYVGRDDPREVEVADEYRRAKQRRPPGYRRG